MSHARRRPPSKVILRIIPANESRRWGEVQGEGELRVICLYCFCSWGTLMSGRHAEQWLNLKPERFNYINPVEEQKCGWNSLFDKVLQLGLDRPLCGLNHFLKNRTGQSFTVSAVSCLASKLLQSMPTHSLSASWLMSMVPQKGPNRKTHPLCLQDVRELFRKLVQTLLQDRHLRLDLSHFKYFLKM